MNRTLAPIALLHLLLALLGLVALAARAQPTTQVVDVPTRDGVSVRVLYISPAQPKATLLLLIGGHGGMQITPDGKWKWGGGNFLMRSRQLFVDQGVAVGIVDAPSDRQQPPFLDFFRNTSAHVADLKAVIASARSRSPVPVWLVGTSRGTESVAYAASQLRGADAPDGIVLSSTILSDPQGQPVTAMSLGRIEVPVLVVHHEEDSCRLCSFSEVPGLMRRLSNTPRKQLLSFKGGESRGDPCEAFAHHGYNGQEADVVAKMVAWVLER